jgi:hypothetical protein
LTGCVLEATGLVRERFDRINDVVPSDSLPEDTTNVRESGTERVGVRKATGLRDTIRWR